MSQEENVRVYVRLRPLNGKEISNNNRSVINVKDRKAVVCDSGKGNQSTFSFDFCADDSVSQSEFFDLVGKPIAENCIKGYNGTIFAYGQTGSGKTFTIQGPSNYEDMFSSENGENFLLSLSPQVGIIPRILNHLFSLMRIITKESGGRCTFFCKCSMLEIYNENIIDLLSPSSQHLQIREDVRGQASGSSSTFVEGLRQEAVNNPHEALNCLSLGIKNRTTGATSMNSESSRSHSVFTLYIESRESKNTTTTIRYSRLNLVDLAGSERQKSTEASGIRLKEAGAINKSLSALGNVIHSLVDIANGLPRHVHYRDSKLTFLLKDSLGGNSKTTIVATISPANSCSSETISTLKFAQRAKLIQNSVVINEDNSGGIDFYKSQVSKLSKEVQLLQSQIARISANSLDHGKSPFVSSKSSSVATSNTPMKASQPSDTQDQEQQEFSNDGESPEKIAQLMDHIATLEKNFREVMDASYSYEKEKSVLLDKITQLEELLKKKDDTLNGLKLSLKLKSKQQTVDPAKIRDREIEALQLEIKTLQDEKKVLSQESSMKFYAVKERLEVYENRYGDQIRAENDKIKKLEELLHDSQQQVNELLIQKSEILAQLYLREEEIKQSKSVPQYKQEDLESENNQMEIQESLDIKQEPIDIQVEQSSIKQETPKRTSMGAFLPSSNSSVKKRRTQSSLLWTQSNTSEIEELTSQLYDTRERLMIVEDNLEKKISELRSEQDIRSQQEETIKQLQSALSSSIADSSSTKESLQQQIFSLESQIVEKERDLQNSNSQLKEVTIVLKQYQEMLKSSTSQCESLQQIKNNFEEQLQRSEQANSSLRTSFVESEQIKLELENAKNEHTSLLNRFNSVNQELSSSRILIQELEAQLQNTRSEPLDHHMQIDPSNEKVSILEKQNEEMKQRLEEALREQSQLEKLVEKQQDRIYQLTDQIKKLELNSTSSDQVLQEKVQEANTHIHSLQEKIHAIEEELNKAKQEKEVMISELYKKETEQEAIAAQLLKLETEKDFYHKQCKQLQVEVNSLSGHSNSKQKIQHTVKVKEENNNLKKEVLHWKETCFAQAKEINKLKTSKYLCISCKENYPFSNMLMIPASENTNCELSSSQIFTEHNVM